MFPLQNSTICGDFSAFKKPRVLAWYICIHYGMQINPAIVQNENVNHYQIQMSVDRVASRWLIVYGIVEKICHRAKS